MQMEQEMRKQKVIKVFDELNINYTLYEHPAMHTAGDCDKYDIEYDGLVCKNLFVRNKNKSMYYLISLPLMKRANLKNIQEALGETRLSFGSEEALQERLNISPGSVSLLNIIDANNIDTVKFVVDNTVLTHERVGFHPNVNTATITFPSELIAMILGQYDVEPIFIEVE